VIRSNASDSVRFTETMRGYLAPFDGQAHEQAYAAGKSAGTEAYFILTVVTTDVAEMTKDPNHRSPAYGCLVFPALSTQPLRVTDGHLDLFVDAAPDVVHMRYGLNLQAPGGHRYYLRGVKEIVRQRFVPSVLYDTTTLYVDVYPGDAAEGAPLHRGILRMGPGGVTAQGLSFRGEGPWLGFRAIARFAAYYIGRVQSIYLGPRALPLRR